MVPAMPQVSAVLATRATFSLPSLSLWSGSPFPLFQWTDWSPVRGVELWFSSWAWTALFGAGSPSAGTSVVRCALVRGRGGSPSVHRVSPILAFGLSVSLSSQTEEGFLKHLENDVLSKTKSKACKYIIFSFSCFFIGLYVCVFLIPQGISPGIYWGK